MKKIMIIAWLMTIVIALHAQSDIGLPKINKNDIILYHQGFTIGFNSKYKQPNWVAYHLTKENTKENIDIRIERKSSFCPDPAFINCAKDQDYAAMTDIDRGHLFPANNAWNETIEKESFYYTNISPQHSGFNRGIWKHLENLEHEWTTEYGDLYIVTGPILTDFESTDQSVPIPKTFFKIILDYHSKPAKAIAFILKNEKTESADLYKYAVSIDQVEKTTGFDFFANLSVGEQDILESQFEVLNWKNLKKDPGTTTNNGWGGGNTKNNTRPDNNPPVRDTPDNNLKDRAAQQCQGTTRGGSQCKNMTKDPSGYCYWHQKNKK